MNKKDLIAKLGSRKFWVLLAGLATAICLLFGIPQEVVVKVVGAIGAFGTIITYIMVQGFIDMSSKPPDGNDQQNQS